MSATAITGSKKSSRPMTSGELMTFERRAFDNRKKLGLDDSTANRGLTNKFSTEQK